MADHDLHLINRLSGIVARSYGDPAQPGFGAVDHVERVSIIVFALKNAMPSVEDFAQWLAARELPKEVTWAGLTEDDRETFRQEAREIRARIWAE